MTERGAQSPKVAVVGGGLAGLAAGCVLADSGLRVTLFERRSYLGGRASSYQHPGTGEVVDNCQHVLLGCCTNLVEFYQRIGASDKIRWYDRLTFLEPGGRASVIQPSALPAPLHTAPAFLRAACLNLSDKIAIAAGMAALTPVKPRDTGKSFLQWLRRHGQTERAIERFWKTVLVSALNEDLDLISIPYAAQVVRESFLKSPAAGRMGVPTVPLTELYSRAGEYIGARGGEVRFRSSVESFRGEFADVKLLTAGTEEAFDFVVLAVPFDALSRMLPQTTAAEPLRETLGQFSTSPITGIHLWFDRQITDLEHAVLLDRTIQWMFHKSKLLERGKPAEGNGREPRPDRNGDAGITQAGSYVELVVSSSKNLVEKSRQEITDLALAELREFFPGARNANLVKSTVIKEVHATYSPRPGIESRRPRPETVWPRIFLSGDWTATGWPATMEGAVRSGYAAAECVARVAGLRNANFLVPDLPASGLMRLFG
ncbi:MAG TPA: hydroxysqualene dehydroxylase HpnE [Terriglobales bacterium]|jgi:zeta-carotene desaturase|nr:hydroxysqualene dehydroxylase HpnE [Terriglobales bacterium]